MLGEESTLFTKVPARQSKPEMAASLLFLQSEHIILHGLNSHESII